MNVLFIEDEKELSGLGVSQLKRSGFDVFPVYDIAEAQAIMDDPACPIDYIIADHRLPDGLGISFIIRMKEDFPKCKCAIVSGCLTANEVDKLEALDIPYYRKPLIYSTVIRDLLRMHAPPTDAPSE